MISSDEEQESVGHPVPSESFITTIGTAPLSSTTAAVSTPSSLTVASLNLSPLVAGPYYLASAAIILTQ